MQMHEDITIARARTDLESKWLANTGLRCRIDSLRKRSSHKLGTVVVRGHYTFTFLLDGAQTVVPARLPFALRK
ncbi:hypothetical protein [Paracoccus homiensis]|nr:hypothetical protein [Paracoccus homiensis]